MAVFPFPSLIEITGWYLSLFSIGLMTATAIGVLAGFSLYKRPSIAGRIFFLDTINTLSWLALCVLALPFVGISGFPLFTLSILGAAFPIAHATYVGLRSIDKDVVDTMRSLGMKEQHLVQYVQLPLATASIMGGIRTASVFLIGVVTIVSITTSGFRNPDPTAPEATLESALPAMFVAVFFNLLLSFLENQVRSKEGKTQAA